MPGTLHQGILKVFRDDPWLAFDLLGVPRPVRGTPIDRRAELDHATDKLDKIRSRYPDLVLVWQDEDNDELGIVIGVETQGEPDPKKRWRLAGYHGALADEHELNTWMIVVSFSRVFSASVRKWSVGPPPRIDVLLLDADTLAPLGSLEQARQRPTAAVLVGALHGRRGNLEAARMARKACDRLPERQRRDYLATTIAALPRRLRDTLIGELNVEEPYPLWSIERESGTYQVGVEAGIEQGIQRGIQRGIEQGVEQGRRLTLIEMILALLEVRGIAVDADSEARIRSCDSVPTLQRWARAAREVNGAAALFG